MLAYAKDPCDPEAAGLGIKVDMAEIEKAYKLYVDMKLGRRDDALLWPALEVLTLLANFRQQQG